MGTYPHSYNQIKSSGKPSQKAGGCHRLDQLYINAHVDVIIRYSFTFSHIVHQSHHNTSYSYSTHSLNRCSSMVAQLFFCLFVFSNLSLNREALFWFFLKLTNSPVSHQLALAYTQLLRAFIGYRTGLSMFSSARPDRVIGLLTYCSVNPVPSEDTMC